MEQTIKYIAFYAKDNSEKRQVALSAKNKIDYICQALDVGRVNIISPSWTNSNSGIYTGKKIKIDEKIELTTFFSFGTNNRLGRGIKYCLSLFQLFLYLVFFTKKKETIIVYHSLMLYFPIKLIKKIKKINIILEVEEIYQDIQSTSNFMKEIERKLFDMADKFIFSTELLNEKLNKENKPYVIIYGTYKVEQKIAEKYMDGKIHLVYAGTLDPRKGGMTAVQLSKYLNKNYHVHIIGFGKEEEKNKVLNLIKKVSLETECKVTFDGLLKNKEYTEFIQKCHIGLSPQSPDAKYNETSFPSKVLSYMSNGLRVVSIKLKTLEISKIKELIYFYDSDNPKEIANRILEIDFNDNYDSKKEINFLDNEFKKNINKILEKTND